MSDFEEALKNILSSPEDMQKIAALAEGLGLRGGGATGGTADDAATLRQSAADYIAERGAAGGVDPELMGKIAKLAGAYNGKSDKTALIEALSPYINTNQRSKLARAAEYAKLARAARSMLE